MLGLLSEAGWRRFISEHSVDSQETARAYLQERIIAGYVNGMGFWLIESKASGKPLGICGLIKRDYLAQADLGFALLEQHWGCGYASEASRATIDYAFEELALSELLAVTVPENARSIRLLEHLGFQYQRKTRDPKDEEVSIYSLSRDRWVAA
jgi:RimJ/RimL family protein N-acetyltransferase